MKTKLIIAMCTAVALLAFGNADVSAAEQSTLWNYEDKMEVTEGAFTYHAYTSKDGQNAWIHRIDINVKKNHSTLDIPENINGKTVTHIGYTPDAYDFSIYEDEAEDAALEDFNLFGGFVDRYHSADGNTKVGKKLKKITIPETVEVIQPATFSGVDYITTIEIPEKVKKIESDTFYDCDSLKTVKLPDALEELNVFALAECPKLSELQISAQNAAYKVKNKCLISKKDNALIYVLPKTGTLKIPNGTKCIRAYAFCNATASKVNIPSSVINIEAFSFQKSAADGNKAIKNITVSSKNKMYAKDGQCIYNKKDKSLVVGIPDDSGVLRISNKVKRLTCNVSLINCNTNKKELEKVIFPKKLKYVEVPAFSYIADSKKVYFTGKQPPKVVVPEGTLPGWAELPVFSHVYVPEKSAKTYKKWYKQHKCYSYVDGFHTF